MFGWCTFMKLTLMKNGVSGTWPPRRETRAPPSRRSRRRTGMPTTPSLPSMTGVSTYWPLILKSSVTGAAGVAGERALGDLGEHLAQRRVHVGEPGRVGVGVGVQVVEPDVFHLVVALGVRQRVVRLAEVPLAGEVGLVAGRASAPRRASTPPPAGRRPGPGRRRWSCRCGWGCGRSASRRGRACSSAGRRTRRRSCPRRRAGRCSASACRGPRRRRRARGRRSRCRPRR